MAEDSLDKTPVRNRVPSGVAAKAPSARLYCVDTSVLKDGAGARIALDDSEVSVGRDSNNRVPLRAQGVSRRHARLFCEDGNWTVEDLNSTNGTRVNNSKLTEKQSLKHGDTVAFGRACYKFQLLDIENEGATTGVDIDLGASDKWDAIRPGQSSTATVPGAAKPRAPASTSVARATFAAKPAPAKSDAAQRNDGSNAVLWIIVIVALTALVVGAAKLLGIF